MATLEHREIRSNKKLRNNEYYNTQDTFDMLYEQGKSNKKFSDLMQYIISEENILLAYRNIKKNKGSKTCGTNKRTIIDIGEIDINKLINYVRYRLSNYEPKAVRRVEIPKPNSSKKRPLGIPTIEDRLIQQCIKQILEPICESKFSNHNYGFRPNRSTHHAISRCMFLINQNRLHYVVDLDIQSFFDNVDHSKLIKQMWNLGMQDKQLICIISKMLKAEIEGIGIPTKGTPQGGILSPLLSNIALNELDWWISDQWETFETKRNYNRIRKGANGKYWDGLDKSNKYRALRNSNMKEMFMVRYADDFKIFCRDAKSAQKIYVAVKQWLKERLHLDISPEKSTITNLRKNYTEFLGFKLKAKLKGKKIVCMSHVSNKAFKNIEIKLKERIIDIGKRPTHKNVAILNSTILGMHNFYKYATYINVDFSKINFLVKRTLYNRLKSVSKAKGNKSKTFLKFYGKYNFKTYFINGVGIFPIAGITTKTALGFTQSTNNYTTEGRKLIHKNLQLIDYDIVKYIMENPIPNQSTELNDNQISLYVGQNGKCGVTGKKLWVGMMEVHHKIPIELGGTDEYKNLIYVNYNIYKLIHATKEETIKKYLEIEKLDENAFRKLNILRKKVGNYII